MRLVPGLLIAIAVALVASLFAGRVWIDPAAMPNAYVILAELRLPRSVLALVIGAGLGAAGAGMQGYLRNPLADPGLFGIAPGAAFGGVVALSSGGGVLGALTVPIGALMGAGAAMGLLSLLAGRSAGVTLFTLAGLMISSLAGALTSLVITLASNAFALAGMMNWLIGALTDRSWQDVAIAAPLTLVGVGLLYGAGRALDALTLGEEAARSLGIDPQALRWLMIMGVALTVGSGVAVAGVIGFVGLMVPHLVRPFTDRAPSSLILPSALAGALLVLLADMFCRVLPLVNELKLGIALNLLGAPFFLHLLLKMRRGNSPWS